MNVRMFVTAAPATIRGPETGTREVSQMRTKYLVGALAVAGTVFGAASALAHHAFAAEFDANRPVNLRGNVVRIEWINPHAWIHLDQKMPDGSVQHWMVEGG